MSVATWYLVEDDGTVLVNMDAGRARLGWIEQHPHVSLTALKDGEWYTHVSVRGPVVRWEHDEATALADIDRLSPHYGGEGFGNRTAKRVSAWFEIKQLARLGARLTAVPPVSPGHRSPVVRYRRSSRSSARACSSSGLPRGRPAMWGPERRTTVTPCRIRGGRDDASAARRSPRRGAARLRGRGHGPGRRRRHRDRHQAPAQQRALGVHEDADQRPGRASSRPRPPGCAGSARPAASGCPRCSPSRPTA